jgi:peptidoglycan/LPS O-acetylase OafA/YrhL
VTAASPARSWHFPALDSVRAMAVFCVLVHHIWNLGLEPLLHPRIPLTGVRIPLYYYLQGAGLGVDIFFVLSGFLLSMPWHRHVLTGGPAVRLGPYFRRRFLRIFPPYYGVLFAVLVFFTPAIVPWELVATGPGVQRIVAHLLLMQQILPMSADGFRVLGSLWTLTIEMIFYLTLPVMVVPFLRRRWLVAAPVAVVSSVLYLWLARNSLGFVVDAAEHSMRRYAVPGAALRVVWLANQFPTFIAEFALGISAANLCVLARSAQRPRILDVLERELVCVLLTVVGFGTVLFAFYVNGSQRWGRIAYYGDHLIAGVGTTMIVVAVTQASGPTTRFLGLAPFRWLGIIGYSVFLWHLPVIYAVNKYPSFAGLTPKQHFVQLTCIVVAITIPLSVAYYNLVEKPFMRSGTTASPAPPPRPEPAADEPRPAGAGVLVAGPPATDSV